MKKLVLLISVVSFGLGLTACKKQYTCPTYTQLKSEKAIQVVKNTENTTKISEIVKP